MEPTGKYDVRVMDKTTYATLIELDDVELEDVLLSMKLALTQGKSVSMDITETERKDDGDSDGDEEGQ